MAVKSEVERRRREECWGEGGEEAEVEVEVAAVVVVVGQVMQRQRHSLRLGGGGLSPPFLHHSFFSHLTTNSTFYGILFVLLSYNFLPPQIIHLTFTDTSKTLRHHFFFLLSKYKISVYLR